MRADRRDGLEPIRQRGGKEVKVLKELRNGSVAIAGDGTEGMGRRGEETMGDAAARRAEDGGGKASLSVCLSVVSHLGHRYTERMLVGGASVRLPAGQGTVSPSVTSERVFGCFLFPHVL
jgi:hypothetical protein